MPHALLGRGLQARAVIGEVIHVRAVEHGREAAARRLAETDHEEAVLAEIATIGRVLGVAWNVELVGLDQEVLDAEGSRQLPGVVDVFLGRGGGAGRERQAALAEHVVGDAEEEARVDAPGEGDQYRRQLAEQCAEPVDLGVELHHTDSVWKRSVVR